MPPSVCSCLVVTLDDLAALSTSSAGPIARFGVLQPAMGSTERVNPPTTTPSGYIRLDSARCNEYAPYTDRSHRAERVDVCGRS